MTPMFEEYEKRKQKQISLMRSLMDYGMGTLFLILGFVLLFGKMLKIKIGYDIDPVLEKLFGGLCVLYGAWRIYRGYKKNYFR